MKKLWIAMSIILAVTMFVGTVYFRSYVVSSCYSPTHVLVIAGEVFICKPTIIRTNGRPNLPMQF